MICRLIKNRDTRQDTSVVERKFQSDPVDVCGKSKSASKAAAPRDTERTGWDEGQHGRLEDFRAATKGYQGIPRDIKGKSLK